MDRAGMQGRSGDVSQPGCSKCGSPILTTKQGVQCPKCDKVGARQQPGGYRVVLSDKSVKYFDTEKELTDFLGRKTPKNPAIPKPTTLAVDVDDGGVDTLPSADIAFELIDKELGSAKFETMADAKKILSVRKKLNNLRFDVKQLLGGK